MRIISGCKSDLQHFWYDRMHDAPDLVFRYEADKIKLRSDDTCVLSGKFTISGTLIKPIPIETLQQGDMGKQYFDYMAKRLDVSPSWLESQSNLFYSSPSYQQTALSSEASFSSISTVTSSSAETLTDQLLEPTSTCLTTSSMIEETHDFAEEHKTFIDHLQYIEFPKPCDNFDRSSSVNYLQLNEPSVPSKLIEVQYLQTGILNIHINSSYMLEQVEMILTSFSQKVDLIDSSSSFCLYDII
jgi:hypothetical protein